jgi:hypothetical protein
MSAELIAAYEEHLVLVRNLAENSIRGYVSDLESFLKHLEKLQITEFSDLELTHIRSWLAELQSSGVARATMARRIVSIRAFTYWGASQGWIRSDIGSELAIPKAHRTLPEVLDIADTEIVLASVAMRANEDQTPLALRDLALIEVLYATGIRVSEICGLDIRSIDEPCKSSAREEKNESFRWGFQPWKPCVTISRTRGQPWLLKNLGARSFSAQGVVELINGRFVRWFTKRCLLWVRGWDRMGCDIQRLPTCSKVGQIYVLFRRYWAIHPWQPPRFTPMFRPSGCKKLSRPPIPEPD